MRYLLTGLLFFLSIYCTNAQDTALIIGSGGGVVGTATVYKITPDGKVLKGGGMDTYTYSAGSKVKKSIAKKLFRTSNKLGLESLQFNHPGNLYYFLTTTSQSGSNTVTWGDNAHATPDDIKAFYADVMKRIKSLSFRPL